MEYDGQVTALVCDTGSGMVKVGQLLGMPGRCAATVQHLFSIAAATAQDHPGAVWLKC